MGAPQIILIVSISIRLLVNAYMHGKPRDGKYNMFTSLADEGLMIWIIIAGGFFN
jgi:hypothetical protein